MPEDPKLKQQTQTNSQTQAGAAAQLIVNIFLVSASATEWVVKPIAFHVDGAEAIPDSALTGSASQVDVQMDAGRHSNAQGQGLTVLNDVILTKVLERALLAGTQDTDIVRALQERR